MTTKTENRSSAGEAGRRGADVRSDLWVHVEVRDSGGLDLQVRSKVEAYYGDVIRSQLRALCSDLGVEHARLEVEDQGALPFTIAARVECLQQRLNDVRIGRLMHEVPVMRVPTVWHLAPIRARA